MSNDTINVSLNEISFFVTRAAVGAGAPFGVAEDFAKAVMWSARCGADPAVAALSSLNRLDASPNCGHMTLKEDGPTRIFDSGNGLSAAFAATALMDFWPLANSDEYSLVARGVDNPLLAAAALAAGDTAPAVVEWPGVRVTFSENGVADIGAANVETLLTHGPVDLSVASQAGDDDGPAGFTLNFGDLNDALAGMLNEGVDVDADAWSGVVSLFRRCLVPSSEQSRMSGAGAGLVDTD